jgi:hypothetical protein
MAVFPHCAAYFAMMHEESTAETKHTHKLSLSLSLSAFLEVMMRILCTAVSSTLHVTIAVILANTYIIG